MKKLFSLALAASAALCLTACASLTQSAAVLDDVGPALQVVVAQDAEAGLIDQATADKLVTYIGIVHLAVQAAQAGNADCAGATQADCAAASAERALTFAHQLLAEAPIAALFNDAAAARVAGYLEAGQRALLAAKDAAAAGKAQTEQERTADVMAAVIQVNAALLTALSTAHP